MRLAVIDDQGRVTNIIRVTPGNIPPEYQGMPEDDGTARVGGSWDAETGFTPPAPKPVTNDQVNAERERRLAAGVTVTLAGYGDIQLQGRQQDMIAYMGLRDAARKLDAAGQTGAVIQFRDRGNVKHTLTPQQVIELIDAGQGYVSDVFAASWILKDQSPIPQDFADDANWP